MFFYEDTNAVIADKLKEETVRRMESIIDFLPDATFAIDMEGKVIAWNRAMQELTSISAREIIGKGDYEYAIPLYGFRRPLLIDLVLKFDPNYENQYFQLERTEDHLIGEAWTTLQDGSRRCLWAVASLLLDSVQKPIGAIESIRDTTNRMRLEEELRESESRYRSIFETNTVVMLLVDPETGNIMDANRTACKFYGYSRKALMEMNISNINTLPFEEIKKRMQAAAVYESVRNSFIHRLANGETRNVEVNSSPIKIKNKTVLFSIISDVSERIQFETALQESEEQLHGIFEASPIGIGIFGPGGNMVDVSQSFLDIFGLEDKKRLIGINLFTYFNLPENFKEDIEEHRHIQVEKSVDLQKFSTAYSIPSLIKGIVHIEMSITLLKGKDPEKMIGYLMLIKDITEQKMAEERIKYISMHDALTGLYNRGFFTAEMDRFGKSRDYPVTIIMADVDGLKILNDTKGHIAGDQLLIYSAQILHSAFRKEDIIARLGGDEFGVILPDCTSRAGERSILRIKQCIDQHNMTHPDFQVSISLGKATAVTPCDLNKVMDEADHEMYLEKAKKKRNNLA
jgi:diguanylate cyclase (GGDEF)-like protein/PAS domain S-box-containing protein